MIQSLLQSTGKSRLIEQHTLLGYISVKCDFAKGGSPWGKRGSIPSREMDGRRARKSSASRRKAIAVVWSRNLQQTAAVTMCQQQYNLGNLINLLQTRGTQTRYICCTRHPASTSTATAAIGARQVLPPRAPPLVLRTDTHFFSSPSSSNLS